MAGTFLLLSFLVFQPNAIAAEELHPLACELGYRAVDHRGPEVKDYWHMDPETRRKELSALVKENLTPKEVEALRKVHMIAGDQLGPDGKPVKVGNYFWQQLRRKSEELKRLGYTPEQRSNLIRSGAVGFLDDFRDNFERISEGMAQVQAITGDVRGALDTRSMGQMVGGDYQGALKTEAQKALYDFIDDATSPPSPRPLYTATGNSPSEEAAIQAAREAAWKKAERPLHLAPGNTTAADAASATPKKLKLDADVLKEMSPEAQRRGAELGYLDPASVPAAAQSQASEPKKLKLDADVLKEMSPEAQRRGAELGYLDPASVPAAAQSQASEPKQLKLTPEILSEMSPAAQKRAAEMGLFSSDSAKASSGKPVGAGAQKSGEEAATESINRIKNILFWGTGAALAGGGALAVSHDMTKEEPKPEESTRWREEEPATRSSQPNWDEGWDEGIKLFDEIINLCEAEQKAGASDYQKTLTYSRLVNLLEKTTKSNDPSFIALGQTALADCAKIKTSSAAIAKLSGQAQKQAIACGKSAQLRRCIDKIQAAGNASQEAEADSTPAPKKGGKRPRR